MYADEFGVLRYVRNNPELGQVAGSPIVHNSSVSVSNNILRSTEDQINYNFTGRENEFENNFFCHSIYVSNYFVLMTSSVAQYAGLERSSYLRAPAQYNIKITDAAGNEDISLRYKIILEKYTNNSNKSELIGSSFYALDLYRIIVLLDSVDPKDIYLMYDKYEMDEDQIPYNPHFGYRERINAVPYYQYIAEESEVIDPSSENKRFYSTQLFSHKENNLLKTRIENDGWKIYVPRKAKQDPRTFQNFNWRLIAKINYNFSQTKNVYSTEERPVLNVGILYSGSVDEVKNAYIFDNLQKSSFNVQKYIFNNPNANAAYSKSEKQYWLVDLNNLQNNYSNYDLLVWTPTKTITEQEATTVETILSQNISVFIDMSLLGLSTNVSTNLSRFGFSNLTVQNLNTGYITIVDDYKNADQTMSAWSLSSYVETSSNLPTNNVIGKRKDIFNSNAIIPISVFVGTVSTESRSTAIVKQGDNAVVIKRSTNTGNLYPSSLTIVAHPLLQLINDVFSADGSQTANNGSTNVNSGLISSETIEGPNKLFYNILMDISKTKANRYSAGNTTNESTILWNVSPWRNSWTINGIKINNTVNVLSPQEQQAYNFSFKSEIDSTADAKFCRQVAYSLSQLLYVDFEQTINGGDAQNIINTDFSNVTFYIECTNKNVEFLNFNDITQDVRSGLKTLIGQSPIENSIFELSTRAKSQIVSGSAVSLDAVSKVFSGEINFSDIAYPFVITNTSEYQERIGSNIKTPNDLLPGSQVSRDYSFKLKTQVAINEITKTVNSYRVYWSAPFTSVVTGSADFSGYLISKGETNGSLARTTYSVIENAENKIQIKKIFSPFHKYNYPSRIFSRTDIRAIDYDATSYPQNNFHYTGDIDEGNRWDEYFYGKDSPTTTSVATGTKSYNVTSNITKVVPISVKQEKTKKLTKKEIENIILDGQDLPSSYFFTVYFTEDIISSMIGTNEALWDDLVVVEGLTNIYGPFALPFKKLFNIWLARWIKSSTANLGAPISKAEICTKFIEDFKDGTSNNVRIWRVKQDSGSETSSVAQKLTPTVVTTYKKVTTYVNGYSQDYVKYVQYTLSKQNYRVTINGVYDKETSDAVRLFQDQRGESFIDGIVDSETKSVLAIYWLGLYKNDQQKFENFVASAPNGVAKYIRAAVKYSDIANIGVPGREYRRISFTGVPGPTEIVDDIIVKVPQAAAGQKVHDITISTGGWPVVVDSVYLYEKDFDVNAFYTSLKENAKIPNANYRVAYFPGSNEIKANSKKTINFDTFDGVENIKYIMIKLKGKKITNSKFGPNAEGFSISNITFSISADGTYIPPEYGSESKFEGLASGQISGYTEINASEQKSLNFSTLTNLKAGVSTVTSIAVNSISFTATSKSVTQTITHSMPEAEKERKDKLNSTYTFDQSYPGSGNVNIVVNALSESLSLNMGNAATIPISSVQQISSSAAPSSVPSSDFSITKEPSRPNQYILKTNNGIQYDSKESFAAVDVSSYYVADADNIASRQNQKLTINVKDGLVVLTDAEGRPAGFPNFSSYTSSINRIYGLGFIYLIWGDTQAAPYGLDWQFLYIDPTTKQKTFLGKKMSYFEYLQKGALNIYIGLNAYDADMDSTTTGNIVGEPSRNSMLVEAMKPTRYICPVYSVKVNNRPKISVSAPPSTLTKFDTWYVNVSPGKFIKTITVPSDYNFTNWLREYKGKQLKCYYDTTKIKTPYSSIFGFGYYDVHEENPIIVSDNQIQLRHGQIHCVQEQYDKTIQSVSSSLTAYTDASPIVPWIKVYVKKSNDTFVEISRKEIKEFNKHTGLVTFKKEIVPLQSKDIKVSYTIKSSNIMIHQIDGQLLDLNPYNNTKSNKPIFLYLLPVDCEESIGSNATKVTAISDSLGPIKYTTDANIFNRNSNIYNPLALHIATVTINNNYSFDNVKVQDMRVRGGGLLNSTNITKEFESNKDIASYTDLYTGKSYLHPNGGYVVVQIPIEVLDNFNSKDEVYNIVRNNLTAGVSFDIQDVDGTDWRSISNDV